jgi:hypothetical protein
MLLLLLSLLAVVIDINSQLSYPCDSIPVSLRIGARAVIRSCQRKITIIDETKSRLESKMVVTLLNDQAEDLLMVGIPYDKLRRISSIRASAYDESGRLIWTLKKYDISDVRDFSGPEKLSDARKKVFEIPSFNYPFTIEYSYKMIMEDLFLSPVLYMQPDPEISVEESGLMYSIPIGLKFNYKTLNIKSPIDCLQIKKRLNISWKEENLPAGRQQKYAESLTKKLPVVYATPVNFNLRGYKGSFQNWLEYGRWMNRLIEGRDVLDSMYAEKAKTLVENIPDRKERIKVLYTYMQQNTHYFYTGFGIGGNQPIPANEVARNGYGDCKALSNYMKALLKTIGIESYYTLVRSGDGKSIQPDIPCSQFDHVILCIPDDQDTIWLECTDPTAPFNYLGNFTCNREVVAITPKGGKLLRTPVYGKNDNIISTHTEVELFGSGDAKLNIRLFQTGLMYNELKEISLQREDIRKSMISGLLDNLAIELAKEHYHFGKERVPFGIAQLEVHIRDFSAKGGNRLFITPLLLSKFSYMLEDPAEIELKISYQRHDTVRIALPEGYVIDYLPAGLQIDSRFGKYSSCLSCDNQYIYYVRDLEINAAVYPEKYYADFHKFIDEVADNDRKMLILKAAN